MNERRRKMRCKWEKRNQMDTEKRKEKEIQAGTLLIIYRTIFLKVTYKTKGKANQELT